MAGLFGLAALGGSRRTRPAGCCFKLRSTFSISARQLDMRGVGHAAGLAGDMARTAVLGDLPKTSSVATHWSGRTPRSIKRFKICVPYQAIPYVQRHHRAWRHLCRHGDNDQPRKAASGRRGDARGGRHGGLIGWAVTAGASARFHQRQQVLRFTAHRPTELFYTGWSAFSFSERPQHGQSRSSMASSPC